MGASALGAEITTFFAPEFKWVVAVSMEVKIPVHSATISVFIPDQSILEGSLSAVICIGFPFTINLSSLTSIEPSKVP